MATIRKNITISQAALDQAKELKAAAYSTTRSGVINRAVNEAWERRFGAAAVAVSQPPQTGQPQTTLSRKPKPIRLRRGKQN